MNIKLEKYKSYLPVIENVLDDKLPAISNLSNLSALLNEIIYDINWVGVYLIENDKLILGPFQGKVACTTIEIGKGVCGHVAKTRESIIVEDVHQFPGHIACDSASNSEIVLPIIKNGILYGVLDIDSPKLDNFDETDEQFLQEVIKILVNVL